MTSWQERKECLNSFQKQLYKNHFVWIKNKTQTAVINIASFRIFINESSTVVVVVVIFFDLYSLLNVEALQLHVRTITPIATT